MPPTHGIGRRHPGDVHPRGAGRCVAAWRAQMPTSVCARAKQEAAERRPTGRLHPHTRVRPARVCTHTQVQPRRVRRCGAARLPGGRLAHAHTRTYVCTHDHATAAPCVVFFFACTRVYPGASPVFPRRGRGALPLSPTAQWTQDPAKLPPAPEPNSRCFPPGLPCERAFLGLKWGGPALHTPPAEQPSQIWGCAPVAPAGGGTPAHGQRKGLARGGFGSSCSAGRPNFFRGHMDFDAFDATRLLGGR